MIEHLLNRAGPRLIRLYTSTLLKMDVVRHAPLPAGPAILAANHPTTTDAFYLLALAQGPMSVLVTESAFMVQLFGRYLRAAGHVPAVRGSGGATVAELCRRLREGRPVLLFPEGLLSPWEGGLQAAHSGVARLALDSGAPVIPVGIGLDRSRIRPFTAVIEGRAEPGRVYMRGGYAVTVGRPVVFVGDSRDHALVRAVARRVMQQIGQLASESVQRLEKTAASTMPTPAMIRAGAAQ